MPLGYVKTRCPRCKKATAARAPELIGKNLLEMVHDKYATSVNFVVGYVIALALEQLGYCDDCRKSVGDDHLATYRRMQQHERTT